MAVEADNAEAKAMTRGKCGVCTVVAVLAGVGALNWGLVGLAQLDLIERLFGLMTPLARTAYILIGVAGLMLLVSMVACCPCRKKDACCGSEPGGKTG